MQGAVTTVEDFDANIAAGNSSTAGGRVFTYSNFNLSSYYQSVPHTDQGGLVPAHGYHSTNYPAIMNVNWWPTKDGIMQYPGDY